MRYASRTGPGAFSTAVLLVAVASLLLSIPLHGPLEAQEQEVGEAGAAPATDYAASSRGTRWLEASSGLRIKMLVEASNLGSGQVELGEITFPANAEREPAPHRHDSIEIFYVLSGVLGHEVDGTTHRLEPGMVGIVRPEDEVVHRVLSEGPVRALVVWAPGGEADRLARFLEERPVSGDGEP